MTPSQPRQQPAVLLAILAALGAAVDSGRAPGRAPGRHAPWTEPAEVAEDVAAGGGLGQAGCFSGNCAPWAPWAPPPLGPREEARDVAEIEADLEESVDSGLVAQPQRRDAPSAAKRTLEDICNNIAVQARVGMYRTALLRCACDDGFQLLDLGDKHYPRHLNVAKCVESAHCRSKLYKIPLLTRRTTPGDEGEVHVGPFVPPSLREHWRFEYKHVPAACECVHPEPIGK